MKTFFSTLIFLTAVSFAANAQCNNAVYQDLINSAQGSNQRFKMQVTIINAASADGTHYYTSWGQSELIFTGTPGATAKFPCQFATPDYFKLSYSDRTKAYIGKLEQPFSVTQVDEQSISIDLINNTIISESKTWQFTVTYKNIVRNGNILYASSDESMIIINLFKYYLPG